MDPNHQFYSSPDDNYYHQSQWENDQWQPNMPSWEATPTREMPQWQYTATATFQGPNSLRCFPNQVPPSPSYTSPSSTNSPLTPIFPHDARYNTQPITPGQEDMRKRIYRPCSLQLRPPASLAEDVMEEEEESDTAIWEPKVAIPRPARPPHRRSASANEIISRNAKRAHTVVEKNYRERLNDKINDLAQYLFETSSDSRAKPSKSLVMSRAKERLKQLESRNTALETEVAALKQRVAILDHIVANSNSGESRVYVQRTVSAVGKGEVVGKQEDTGAF